MIHNEEMSDVQWRTNHCTTHTYAHLPKPARTGGPRCDDRNTINAILFVLTTGCRWADDMSPIQYGSKSTTAHLRLFSELQQKGIWKKKKILPDLTKTACHKQNRISLQKISVDSSSSSIPAKKVGNVVVGFDGFKRITGTKIQNVVSRTK